MPNKTYQGRHRERRYGPKRETTLRFQAGRDRRSERKSRLGRELEERVHAIGRSMVDSGCLQEFTYHGTNSQEDQEGKDFTAAVIVDGERVERSFGVTISGNGVTDLDSVLHPGVSSWSLPWNTKDETIRMKILALFPAAPL